MIYHTCPLLFVITAGTMALSPEEQPELFCKILAEAMDLFWFEPVKVTVENLLSPLCKLAREEKNSAFYF